MIPVLVQRPLAAGWADGFFPPLKTIGTLPLCVKGVPFMMTTGQAHPQIAAGWLVSAFWTEDFHVGVIPRSIQAGNNYYIPNVFEKQEPFQ